MEYLIKNMGNNIRNLSKQIYELSEAHKNNNQEKIEEIERKFIFDQGLYPWLQVSTVHKALHKKLRKSLIEKFQSETVNKDQKMEKVPLGFFGETKNSKVLIDSSKALQSGASLQLAIEQTFDQFIKSCKNQISDEQKHNLKVKGGWQFNETTAETLR